jgi:hypothetical protein
MSAGEGGGKLLMKNEPSKSPTPVASTPWTNRPAAAAIRIAGVKNRKGILSCRIGVSAARIANAKPTAATA